jgi:hypothetical protein
MRKQNKPNKPLTLHLHTVRALDRGTLAVVAGGSLSNSERCTDGCPTEGCSDGCTGTATGGSYKVHH